MDKDFWRRIIVIVVNALGVLVAQMLASRFLANQCDPRLGADFGFTGLARAEQARTICFTTADGSEFAWTPGILRHPKRILGAV